MRVLLVIDRLANRDADRQLVLLAPRLARLGIDAHVAIVGPSERRGAFSMPGVTEHHFGERRWWSPSAIVSLAQLAGRLRPQVVHTWTPPASMLMWLAASRRRFRWAANDGASLAAGESGQRVTYSRAADFIRRAAFGGPDALVARDRRSLAALCAVGRGRTPIHLIAPGVSPEPCRHSRRDVLAEFALPPDARLLLAAGPLLATSRMKELAWATDLMRVLRSDLQWIFFGVGPHRARLERYLRQCRISEHGRFIQCVAEASRLRPHAELFWTASNRDLQPLAMIEAMADGLPVVAANTESHRELVRHGETGFLVEIGDRAGFARAAWRLLENPGVAKQFGEAGRARILSEFSVDRMTQAHRRLYDQLAA